MRKPIDWVVRYYERVGGHDRMIITATSKTDVLKKLSPRRCGMKILSITPREEVR